MVSQCGSITTGLAKLQRGFTVIEMLVVMAAIALLLAVIAPAYVRYVDQAREVALRQDLRNIREALDHFRADKGRYPVSLQEVVSEKYLRALPLDPITERTDSWLLVPAENGETGFRDLHSGAPGASRDGVAYATW